MTTSDYYQALARQCESYARECFDLQAVTRFRLLATEFQTRAQELDKKKLDKMPVARSVAGGAKANGRTAKNRPRAS